MKRKKPLPWWTEYFGVTIDLRFWTRKTWKAYAFYIAPISYLLFTPTPMLPAKPQDSEPHLASPTVDGSKVLQGAPSSTKVIKVSDDVKVMDHDVVKLPGRTFIVPLTGTLMISGRLPDTTLEPSPATEA